VNDRYHPTILRIDIDGFDLIGGIEFFRMRQRRKEIKIPKIPPLGMVHMLLLVKAFPWTKDVVFTLLILILTLTKLVLIYIIDYMLL
jgi:hypothetical protein